MSGVPSWARVGAKVVCIDDSPTTGLGYSELSAGAVYTISWVGYAKAERAHPIYGDAGAGVSLAEVKRIRPIPFAIGRFRPAVEDCDENGIEAQFYHKRGLKSKAPVRESERA